MGTSFGRWLSRDSIEEMGGVDLYEAIQNDALGKIDPLGRQAFPTPSAPAGKEEWETWTEAEAKKIFQDQIDAWRKDKYDFAANLGNHFITKQGPTTYKATQAEIDLIKNSSGYRDAAVDHFKDLAKKLRKDGKNGTIAITTGKAGGPWAFEHWFLTGDLRNALGGAHFYYSGTICLNPKQGDWSVKATMSQEDGYNHKGPRQLGCKNYGLYLPDQGRVFRSYKAEVGTDRRRSVLL